MVSAVAATLKEEGYSLSRVRLRIDSELFFRLVVFGVAIACSGLQAAAIPGTDGNVNEQGFTRIDFCQADETLYAFNGLHLYGYDPNTNVFSIAVSNVGTATTKTWDPADFAFVTDGNTAVLPTGQSEGFVSVDMVSGTAEEETGLVRNYYAIASRFRDGQVFSNGVGDVSMNTIYMIDTAGDGNETEVAEVSNRNSGGICFDAADNLYLADFYPLNDGSGLGDVDIYRISRGQLDAFAADGNFVVVPELLVSDAVLAGSDSIVVDGNYDIYVGSYVGIAKITASSDANSFLVSEVDGDIDANPHAGWPPPSPVFCGIAGDVRGGVLYYGRGQTDVNYIYGPYLLQEVSVEGVSEWPADLDGDGIVGYSDLAILVDDYCYAGEYLKGDLNDDGQGDMRDFAIFAGQWLDKASWYGGGF